MPNRARHAILPAALGIAIVASVWALMDHYYRRLTRDRRQALAGHDVSVLAEGVAAYMRQEASGACERPPRERA